jgi:uncharacterized protein YfaA (DUF2138 family)
MRRTWVFVGLGVLAAGAIAYQAISYWKQFRFTGARLQVNLAQPDALIRSNNLAQMPRDLLKVPIARDVLTEDLAFYYEQHEDKLGVNGAIKRIAYEHNLELSDQILISVFNEPAEMALWRDGKGALRHYALVMRRNMLAKVLEMAAKVALKDVQLKEAGEISTAAGSAKVMALEVNPRRTLLLISQGDTLVVLSDPGLLMAQGDKIHGDASKAIATWFDQKDALARQFALDPKASNKHSFVVGAPTLALGYGGLLSGVKGLRFDFGNAWSTSVWLEKGRSAAGDAALWRAAPANPAACVVVPVDAAILKKVLSEAEKKPELPVIPNLEGSALTCWYRESTLYTPVFVMHLKTALPQRNTVFPIMAKWALKNAQEDGRHKGKDVMVWRSAGTPAKAGAKSGANSDAKADSKTNATLAIRGEYIVFSTDGSLADKALATIARTHPSVADQMGTSNATLALLTPRPLALMAEREMMASVRDDSNLFNAVQTHLPARIKALAGYPAYKLELVNQRQADWQRVEWQTQEARK